MSAFVKLPPKRPSSPPMEPSTWTRSVFRALPSVLANGKMQWEASTRFAPRRGPPFEAPLYHHAPETLPSLFTVDARVACGGYVNMVDTRQG
jgi:hypothetical protein